MIIAECQRFKELEMFVFRGVTDSSDGTALLDIEAGSGPVRVERRSDLFCSILHSGYGSRKQERRAAGSLNNRSPFVVRLRVARCRVGWR